MTFCGLFEIQGLLETPRIPSYGPDVLLYKTWVAGSGGFKAWMALIN